MRRAVVAVIIGGYAFWGIGSGLSHQPVMAGARLTAAVKPANAAELLALPDVDGALVGGASLDAGDFAAIVEAAG